MNEAVDGLDSFDMKLGGLGKFVHSGERLYWCGIQKNEALSQLAYSLSAKLKEYGIAKDEKPFKPHITLGRRCMMKPDFDENVFSEHMQSACMKVEKISLMQSVQKDGKVSYTSLGRVKLRD